MALLIDQSFSPGVEPNERTTEFRPTYLSPDPLISPVNGRFRSVCPVCLERLAHKKQVPHALDWKFHPKYRKMPGVLSLKSDVILVVTGTLRLALWALLKQPISGTD